MPRGTILWVGLITFSIAIYYNWQEVQRTSICDTTYIYEGYADVPLPSDITAAFPRYTLVRYNDNAPQLQQDITTLRHSHRPVPLLFVHGHLGSPQQMRSMASETSREVIKRYKASSTTTNQSWSLWIDWYAVNFNEEPSAFEPRLLQDQAHFVAACLAYLGKTNDTTNPTSPLLLVGYSMGGLVVESALEQLHSSKNSLEIISRLALVLTLGAPRHHLPSFLRSSSSSTSRNSSFSMGYVPPSVHILAGPGDLMIPGLSSWKKFSASTTTAAVDARKVAARKVAVKPVQVDMDDVPGVWCTASHKGMISCNQLVRQTVPMLIDAALLLATATSTTATTTAAITKTISTTRISRAAALRMTTSLLKGMPESIAQTKTLLSEATAAAVGKDDEQLEKFENSSSRCQSPRSTTEIEELDSIYTQQLHRDTMGRNNLCYIWNAEDRSLKKGAIFFLFSGLVPESQINIFVEFDEKDGREGDVDVSGLARPLPGTMEKYPSATDATSKRPWHVILDGVNWMQNTTRILRLPFGTDSDSFNKIKLEINYLPSTFSPPPTFIAQIVPSPAESTHIKPFSSVHIAAGKHPMALRLETAFSFSHSTAAAAGEQVLHKLMQLVIGEAPPCRLQATSSTCQEVSSSSKHSTKAPQHSVPLLLAVDNQASYDDDDDDGGGLLIGDSIRRAHCGLSLWHPSVLNRDIWFISDPRCSYTVSLVWDLGPWISYTLRYHAYAILPLAFALSLLNLNQAYSTESNNFSPLFLVLLLLPALSSVWPEHATALLGRPPWLPLSSIDICLLGCVAYTVLTSLQFLIFTLQNFSARLFNFFPFSPTTTTAPATIVKRSSTVLHVFIYILVLVSSAVHPAMPALLGALILQIVILAATTSQTPPSLLLSNKHAWLVTHILASLPAGIWLFGWIASGRLHGYPMFSGERLFMLVQGMHSCCIASSTIPPATSFSSGIYAKMVLFVAIFVVFSGLWGSLYVVMPAMAFICVWELVSRMMRQRKDGEKRR